jgi:hypothetical protein
VLSECLPYPALWRPNGSLRTCATVGAARTAIHCCSVALTARCTSRLVRAQGRLGLVLRAILDSGVRVGLCGVSVHFRSTSNTLSAGVHPEVGPVGQPTCAHTRHRQSADRLVSQARYWWWLHCGLSELHGPRRGRRVRVVDRHALECAFAASRRASRLTNARDDMH